MSRLPILLLLSACLALPARAAKVSVFLAAGQSNATQLWADGIRDRLVKSGVFEAVAVVRSGHPGSPLYYWFLNRIPQQNYGDDLAALQARMSSIRAAGDTPVFEGFFWVQGETDTTNTQNILNYASNFNDMIERYRSDLELNSAPALVIGITDTKKGCTNVELGPVGSSLERVEALRAVQFQIGAQENATWVDSRGLDRTDVWHLYPAAAVSLGRAMAAAWLRKFHVPVLAPSRAESNSAAKSFRHIDHNRDGVVTRDEWLGQMAAAGKARKLSKRLGNDATAKVESSCDVFFRWFDTDSSESIDSDEWLAGRILDPAMSAPDLGLLPAELRDWNQDGQASYAEFFWLARGIATRARCRAWWHAESSS